MEEYVRITRENCGEALVIYNYYVENSTATYGTIPLSEEEFFTYYQMDNPLTEAFLVKDEGKTIGFVLLKPWNAKKEAYRYTYEVTMYFDKEYPRKGYGKKAYFFLEDIAKRRNLKVLIGGICGENIGSMKLCESVGFEKAGHLKNVGVKFDKFLDIIYYEKIIGLTD